tara:strand:+ start:3284 stop:4564 length:1281 start_codon:yes stop_codon:yes gene_type:complete
MPFKLLSFDGFINESYLHQSLILEGGSYGHMSHPFDDKNLTFGDFKNIVDRALDGELGIESEVTEKTDGQALAVTWRDGKLMAARNKGERKNPLDYENLSLKFQGRGDIESAFTLAMKDLEKAIGSLNDKNITNIFKDGYTFMNLEIIFPATSNVIDYDRTILLFHGTMDYNQNGEAIGEDPSAAKKLQKMIQDVNSHVQDTFAIEPPPVVKMMKVPDFDKAQTYFYKKINKLAKVFNLSDSDEVGLYHDAWWRQFISSTAKEYKYDISEDELTGLTMRWGFFNKSFRLNNKTINDDGFLKWAIKFDKQNHKKQVKDNMLPFELLFLELGVEVLKNIQNFLAISPDKAVQKIKDEINSTINTLKKSNDVETLTAMEPQLDKIGKIGGFETILPGEGIVFKYKGKTYKLTGAFAPVNQILGLIRYGK